MRRSGGDIMGGKQTKKKKHVERVTPVRESE